MNIIFAVVWWLAWLAAATATIMMALKAWTRSRAFGAAPFPPLSGMRASRWTIFAYPLGFLLFGGFIAIGLRPLADRLAAWIFFAAICIPVLPSQLLQLQLLSEWREKATGPEGSRP